MKMSELKMALYNCQNPFKITLEKGDFIYLRCKKCPECLARNKQEWVSRLVAESYNHNESSFVTLTYAHDPGSNFRTAYKDVQLWLKTLRNRPSVSATYYDGNVYSVEMPSHFRYFVTGELGDKGSRLHWHCILYGMPSFPKGNQTTNTSWKHGYVTWEPVTVPRFLYAASYCQKKSEQHNPFFRCSLKPGLGTNFFKKAGKSAYLRGKSPRSIRSLNIGKSHFALAPKAKEIIFKAYIDMAYRFRDIPAIERAIQDDNTGLQTAHINATTLRKAEIGEEKKIPPKPKP